MLKVKLFAAKLLTGRFMSSIFSVFNKKIYSGATQSWYFVNSYIALPVKASIFFGLYESSELRFIRKYLKPNQNVIELGASMGFIAKFVTTHKSPKKMICVEANPGLVDLIHKNAKVQVVNAIVAESDPKDEVYFLPNEMSTGGRISYEKTNSTIKIDLITVDQIVIEHQFDSYVLICDIEGAEYQILPSILSQGSCEMLIIETHTINMNGVKYTPQSALILFAQYGYHVIDQYGSNLVVTKRTSA